MLHPPTDGNKLRHLIQPPDYLTICLKATMMPLPARLLQDPFLAATAASAAGIPLVFAAIFYLEYSVGLAPCPLCLLQRMPIALIGILSALTLGYTAWRTQLFKQLAAPIPSSFGRIALAITNSTFAAIGLALAGRHLWLQNLPPGQIPSCGPDIDTLFRMLPIMDAFAVILQGDGNCAQVQWTLLTLSIPGWSAIAFGLLLLIWLYVLVQTAYQLLKKG
ncbi:MAG: disulfide bond formation protein B [Gammaproteobacteria bacterium]